MAAVSARAPSPRPSIERKLVGLPRVGRGTSEVAKHDVAGIAQSARPARKPNVREGSLDALSRAVVDALSTSSGDRRASRSPYGSPPPPPRGRSQRAAMTTPHRLRHAIDPTDYDVHVIAAYTPPPVPVLAPSLPPPLPASSYADDLDVSTLPSGAKRTVRWLALSGAAVLALAGLTLFLRMPSTSDVRSVQAEAVRSARPLVAASAQVAATEPSAAVAVAIPAPLTATPAPAVETLPVAVAPVGSTPSLSEYFAKASPSAAPRAKVTRPTAKAKSHVRVSRHRRRLHRARH